ncbi:beta strand repeat-containing protein [Nakamurella lactea]|uniref:beta strand repeat-containing protein n=1 Tax=Nakamurella lactea TaxID=459515 RepID=UPI000425CEB3|nr:InlB B-repeat-containing protein [Nakamurella lactea]
MSTSTPRRSGAAVTSRLAFTVALAALGLMTPAVPAMAAPICGPSEVAGAFNGAADGDTVTLGCDVTIATADNLPLDVPSGRSITLDLNGFTLDVTAGTGQAGIGVADGASLTIDDGSSPSTGALIAKASANTGAGIGGDDDGDAGSVIINGGTVTGTGGFLAAGIGGGNGGDGGSVAVNGGTVTATGGSQAAGIGGGSAADGGSVTINGGTVTAKSNGSGAGIGGGSGGNGSTVTIGGGTVTATSSSGAGIGSGSGNAGGPDLAGGDLSVVSPAVVTVSGRAGNAIGSQSDLGTVNNSGTLTLPAGESIDLKDGTLTNSGTLTNAGTISGTGTLAGTGTIANTGAISHTVTVGSGQTVTDHHYGLSFETIDGEVNWNGATPWSIVDGPTLESVGRTTADFPTATKAGYTFTGWFLDTGGTASLVTDTTTLPGTSDGSPVPITLHAGWSSDGPACTSAGFAADFNAAADGDTVTLCGDLTIAPDDDLSLAVAADASISLDLNGHTLNVTGSIDHAGITVPATTSLTIGDASESGTGELVAAAGPTTFPGQTGNAGIGGGSSGAITINSGTVTATGGLAAAGIGAAYRESSGPITINGGTVIATGGWNGAGIGSADYGQVGPVVINGGTVTATGGAPDQEMGAGIGGGSRGQGVDLTISSPAVVTVAGADGYAIGGSLGLGTVTNGGTLILPAGESIDLMDGTLTNNGTISNAGTFSGTGTLTGTGDIDNAGAITHTVTVGDGQTVTDHHYTLTFDANNGELDWADATLWSIVDGPTLESVDRTTADFPMATRAGYTFTGWYLTTGGSSARVTDSTTWPGTSEDGTPVALTLKAGWDRPCTAAGFAADFNGAADGDTVTLCGDLTIAAGDNLPLAVASGKAVTLDLNGHALNVAGGDNQAGIAVPVGASLTIKDTSSPATGSLTASGGFLGAGIGGANSSSGTITIDGGTVVAEGGMDSAGIGGSNGDAGTITINGGVVTATGYVDCDRAGFENCSGAGIGGAGTGRSGTITINGGTIVALGQGWSAGIGGGGASGGSNGGTILITGGDVTATGGDNATIAGAGIGSAGSRTAGPVTITGGTVHATGGRGNSHNSGGAGIGSGGQAGAATGDITISGGNVTAVGGSIDGSDPVGGGAGIGGGGNSAGPTVTISGAGTTVSAAGSKGGAGIGGGGCGADESHGNGGDLTVGAGATVTVTSHGGNPVGNGYGSTGFGTLDNEGTIFVNSLQIIPADVTVTNDGTITASGSFINRGTIKGNGALNGTGTMVNPGAIWHTLTVGDALTVQDHHYQLNFDANDGVEPNGAQPLRMAGAATALRIVNGPTLGSVGLTITDLPAATRAGYTFIGWFLDADGATALTDTTTLPGSSSDGTPVPITLYAGWELASPPTTPTTTSTTSTTSTTTPTTRSTPSPQPTTLTVTTTDLPDGTVGAGYRAAVTATGAADGIYHWSVTGGALPDGLQLSDDGVISGIPTKPGTFTFTVSVNDPATAELTIVVRPATDASSTGSPSSSAGPSWTAPPSTTVPPAGGELPVTGVSGALLQTGIAGLLLALAGALFLMLASRRRSTGSHR